MEIKNDFERELDHLKKVLNEHQQSDIGQKFQQSAQAAAQKVEEKAKQYAEQMGRQMPKFNNGNGWANSNSWSGQAQNSYARTNPQPNPGYGAPPPVRQQPAPRKRKQQPHNQAWLAKQGNVPGQTASTLYKVFGLIGAIPMVPVSVVGSAIMVLTHVPSYTLSAFVGWTAPIAVFFTAMTALGFGMGKVVKRCQQYRQYFSNNKMMTLEQLSQYTQRSKRFLLRDIKKMIRSGGLTDVYFDAKQTCLILDTETYHQYLQLENRRKSFELPEPNTSAASGSNSAIREQGQKFARQIRAANDALPGQEISNKLFRLENITIKLYEHIEKHPEKLDQVQKFMDYYMPTTTKLVSAYQEFESQPTQGPNIVGAKREIEEVLDTISDAFENLLDSMFAEKALDISSDISVMETMFKQDGLTTDDISSAQS